MDPGEIEGRQRKILSDSVHIVGFADSQLRYYKFCFATIDVSLRVVHT